MTAWLGFHAGGFFPGATAQTALATLLALVLVVTLAPRPLDAFGPAAVLVLAGFAGFAAWTLLSASASGAPGRALVEFDRTLLYVAAFAAGVALTRERGDLSVLLRWSAAALFAIAVAGALSRLLPGLVSITAGNEGERLAFPLTYWNAMGVACALGAVLALHAACGDREPPAVRVLATAALPVFVVAGYFPLSRGGIAVAALGAALYLLLALPRRAIPALVCAVPACAIALSVAYGADLLSTEQYATAAGRDQGRSVALVLAACVLGAGAARAALVLLVEPRLDRLRIPRPSRAAAVAMAGLVLVLCAAGALALDAPARIDREVAAFSNGNVVDTGDARDRLSQRAGNGRTGFWRVALDVAADHRLTGSGPGTFRVEWERRRPYPQQANDGHSLYLETLAELGVVGAVLLFLPLAALLVVAVSRLLGPDRMAHAAFVAAGACAARARRPRLGLGDARPVHLVLRRRRLGLRGGQGGTVEGAGPADARAAGARAARAGADADLAAALGERAARGDARLRRQGLPRRDRRLAAVDRRGRASASRAVRDPRLLRPPQLGARNLGIGAFEAAARAIPGSWTPRYGLAIAKALTGRDPRPDAEAALRRNPLEAKARELVAAFDHGGRRRWAREAARAQRALNPASMRSGPC